MTVQGDLPQNGVFITQHSVMQKFETQELFLSSKFTHLYNYDATRFNFKTIGKNATGFILR